MIVVDASALLEALLRTPAAPAVENRLFDARESLHAPHLIDIEVTQVLRRYAAAGEIAADRGREALDDLAALALRRYPHEFLLARVWELRRNLTAYDAAMSRSPRRWTRRSSPATAVSPPQQGIGRGSRLYAARAARVKRRLRAPEAEQTSPSISW